VKLNSQTELALTKLDVLDTFDSIRVCVAYRLDGAEVTNYPDLSDTLGRVEPVYVDLPGWMCDSTGARQPGDLPEAARALIELVEREVGVPVSVVGVGAERDDYVLWESAT